jgi:hypothetical protein
MKRMWPYLGALLPFTTTMSLPAKGWVGDFADDTPNAMRTKNDRKNEEDKKQSGDNADKEANGKSSSDAHAPSHGAYDDTGSGPSISDDENPLSTDGGNAPPKVFSHVNFDDDMNMYASAEGTGKDSGGSGIVTISSAAVNLGTTTDSPAESNGESNQVAPPESSDSAGDQNGDYLADTGYVEPNPADADAMMILLGGTATGSGNGALSSGDIHLDIVDYGWYTVGHGYAKFSASGSDEATAGTFAAVEGADLAFVIDFDYGYMNNYYSVTYVYALDFEEDAIAQMFGWNDLLMQGPFAQWLTSPEEDVSVNGNVVSLSLSTDLQGGTGVAVFEGTTTTLTHVGSSAAAWIQSELGSLSLNGSVTGIDTLVSAAGSLVEIDDQYSSVAGVIVGVG